MFGKSDQAPSPVRRYADPPEKGTMAASVIVISWDIVCRIITPVTESTVVK